MFFCVLLFKCVYVCLYVFVCVYMCLCVFICVYMCLCVFMCAYMCFVCLLLSLVFLCFLCLLDSRLMTPELGEVPTRWGPCGKVASTDLGSSETLDGHSCAYDNSRGTIETSYNWNLGLSNSTEVRGVR